MRSLLLTSEFLYKFSNLDLDILGRCMQIVCSCLFISFMQTAFDYHFSSYTSHPIFNGHPRTGSASTPPSMPAARQRSGNGPLVSCRSSREGPWEDMVIHGDVLGFGGSLARFFSKKLNGDRDDEDE